MGHLLRGAFVLDVGAKDDEGEHFLLLRKGLYIVNEDIKEKRFLC